MNRFEPYLEILKKAVVDLDQWRDSFGQTEGTEETERMREIEKTVLGVAHRLKGNYPFHHPQYAGQMLKPPHPAAWLAYALTMSINPNNHALDGGPPTSEMEKESVQMLGEMVGYEKPFLGHLTSGGTVANLEALFVAREIRPGKAIAASANAHYTHQRMSRVLNTPFLTIPTDPSGMPDISFVEENAEKIGTVVVTTGTTGLGVVEPLEEILELSKRHSFRVHADAAYGGFFKIIGDHLPSSQVWELLCECDSIVIDPHKHGLQPYGCGAILYKDPASGQHLRHDSPYTYFTSDELHLGEISLECSRAGASAAAFWTTLQLLPLTQAGLGSILAKARNAATRFVHLLSQHDRWEIYLEPDLDIVTYFKTPKKRTISELNRVNQQLFRSGMSMREEGFHLSLFEIPSSQFIEKFPGYKADHPNAVVLRSVFMKEEHEGFIDEFTRRLVKTGLDV